MSKFSNVKGLVSIVAGRKEPVAVKSVDQILAVFTDTIKELEVAANAQDAKVIANNERIEALQAENKAAEEEARKADVAITKLRSLFG